MSKTGINTETEKNREKEAPDAAPPKKHARLKSGVKVTAVIFVCILINCMGRDITTRHSIPFWLDTYGTITASYLFGPVPGAIAGIVSNLIFSFWKNASFAYSAVSVFLGFTVGLFARKGYFNTIFHTMTVAGAASSGSVLFSSVINLLLADGSTGNEWGNAVRDYLTEAGSPRTLAIIIGQFYIDFPDKLIACFLLYLAVKLAKHLRKATSAKAAAKAASAAAAFIILLGCLPTAGIRAEASGTGESSGPAEHVSYVQTIFNGSNGLPCGHANAIAQTNDGILWIGTYAGLFRCNGTEFTHLSGIGEVRNVNCLFVDGEGRLWVGTNDNGVVLIVGGKVTNVINSSDGLPADSIRAITQSSNGDYIIGTTKGITVLELKMGISIKSISTFTGYVDKLSADTNGCTAVLNKEGKVYLLNDDRITQSFDLSKEGKQISSVNYSQRDTLFLGTTDGFVCEYDLEGNTAMQLSCTECRGLTKINNVYPDVSGAAWICSDAGIGCIGADGKFYLQESGDFDHSVENMICDYQENLWFASSRLGLLRLTRSCIKDVYTDAGLEPDVVNSTAVYRDMLYCGSDDGLNIIDLKNRRTVENELTQLLSGSRIRCLIPDSSGNLWICSYGKGLVCLENGWNIVSYTDKYPEIGSRVRVCSELSDGSVVAGSSEGVFFIADKSLKGSIGFSDSFGYSQALCFCESKDGTLYAGTDGNGIVKISRSGPVGKLTRQDGLTSEVILRMAEDEDGSIYIVTSNSVCRLTESGIKMLSGVPYFNNYDIIIDGDEVFVPGSAGIYVLNKKELLDGSDSSAMLLNSKNGLAGSLTANAWNALDSSKNLYISADRGVFMMNLDSYLLKQRACRLMVNEVKLDEVSYPAERGSDLTVPRDVTKVEFVPEIINYTYDDPTVSYILEGFDTDWSNVNQSGLTSVSYTNLKPGQYNFRLAVRDDAGNILEESSYSFTKEKALYDNGWFRYYLVGVAGIFIGWLTWFITRRQIERTLTLQQTRLSAALKQVQMGNETILAIAKTVDAKDARTSKHSQRVSEYSKMIAREYGFTEEECENLRRAALLHDIGKIAIPDSVLNKPARLTDEEYAIMKTHVTRGSEILKDFTLIDHVVEGARFHHERYDGRGYPEGLKGEEIPLYGRIIAIADAFDAMTANRVYRKRQDFDYVMSELHKGRGTQFDPELLDIFLKLIDEKKIDIDALYVGFGHDHQEEPAKQEKKDQPETETKKDQSEDREKKAEPEKPEQKEAK